MKDKIGVEKHVEMEPSQSNRNASTESNSALALAQHRSSAAEAAATPLIELGFGLVASIDPSSINASTTNDTTLLKSYLPSYK